MTQVFILTGVGDINVYGVPNNKSADRRDNFCSAVASIDLSYLVSPPSLLLPPVLENGSCTECSVTEMVLFIPSKYIPLHVWSG